MQFHLLLTLFASTTLAYPPHQLHQLTHRRGAVSSLLDSGSDILQSIVGDVKDAVADLDPFDPNAPIDVSGEHAFQAPGDGDQRGPCPGLNALANHGYIARSGVASFVEVIPAMNKVLGVEVELGLLLAVMGVVWTGNPISLSPSFSIGGNDTAVENLLGNLVGILGTPEGLDHSHNFIEADASPTRNDLYVTGDAWTMNSTRFEEWYNMVPEGEDFTFDVMSDFAAKRFNESVETNPYFYYGPFTGMIARNAGFCFITRLMANHSGNSTQGVLTHDTIKSFFGVTGTASTGLTYTPGHERIPQNWYRTPLPYGLVELNLDVVDLILRHPVLGSIGGNVGSINSFTGVDLANVTGGVLNAENLLEGNNLLCFALEVVKLASPEYLSKIYKSLEVPLGLVQELVGGGVLSLECPVWKDLTFGGESLWEGLGSKFQGANESGRAL